MDFSPDQKNISVRLISNPGKIGVTTGYYQISNNTKIIEVKFNEGIKRKPEDELEFITEEESLSDLIVNKKFGRVTDLRNIITHQKIKGDLTNIFYSMESSNTDFYPHQFIPVLKFIETPNSKLLLADEVGIGKTIEALYIWKELQARDNARKLLIVCPSHLRTKWRMECKQKFNISADIIDAETLYQKINDFVKIGEPNEFAYIVSLQGLRPSEDFEDIRKTDWRSVFARLCDDNKVSEGITLFDLVIIDETHHLKNPTTNSYRLGRLLNDSSSSSLLLTATPVQMNEDNLYNIIKLIYPDEFNDKYEFRNIHGDNTSVLKLQINIGNVEPDLQDARNLIKKIISSPYFKNNTLVSEVSNKLKTNIILENKETKVELSRILQKVSLFDRYMSRTRKRDTDEFKADRDPKAIAVPRNKIEIDTYHTIIQWVKKEYADNKALNLVLSSYTKYLTSSFPATLKKLQDKGFFSADDIKNLDDDEEIMDDTNNNLKEELNGVNLDINMENIAKINIQELEKNDSKYKLFIDVIREQIRNNPNEKIVVFAFYKATLSYLQRRLKNEENIDSVKIIGGMEDEEVDDLKEKFETEDGLNILLSSKRGSEGIDLQFCHILVNYDLPWNPMDIEQRIGRLDRLGQKAEKITIINFFYEGTIDEKIYYRLFERIDLFKNTIGDLEDILGDLKEPIKELISPKLTDREREDKLQEMEQTIINKKIELKRVEKDGILLSAFSDYILNEINQSRKNGRWLKPNEIQSYVCDFLRNFYPGTKMDILNDNNLLKISLSTKAKTEFSLFLEKNKSNKYTLLNNYDSECLFNAKKRNIFKKNVELIDPSHPLIKWIKYQYDVIAPKFHKLSAIKCIKSEDLKMDKGEFFYLVCYLSFSGYKKENLLLFQVVDSKKNSLSHEDSEYLINYASSNGNSILSHDLKYSINLKESYDICDNLLFDKYDSKRISFANENNNMCSIHKQRVQTSYTRKINDLESTIDKYKQLFLTSSNEKDKKRHDGTVKRSEGKLKKRKNELDVQLKRIDNNKMMDNDLVPLCEGLIIIE